MRDLRPIAKTNPDFAISRGLAQSPAFDDQHHMLMNSTHFHRSKFKIMTLFMTKDMQIATIGKKASF